MQLRMISYGQHSHQASTRGAQSLAPSLMCAACSCMAREGCRIWQNALQGLMQVQEELGIPHVFLSRAGGIMDMCGSEGSGRRLGASEVDHPWRCSWSRSALRHTFYLARAVDDDTHTAARARAESFSFAFASHLAATPRRPRCP
jgi:hypothetical protein